MTPPVAVATRVTDAGFEEIPSVQEAAASFHMGRASGAAHGLEVLLTGVLDDDARDRAEELLRVLRSSSYMAGALEGAATNPFSTDDEEVAA